MTTTERRFLFRAIKLAAEKLTGAPAAIIERVMADDIMTAIKLAAQEDGEGIDSGSGVVDTRDGLPQPSLAGYPPMPDADPQAMPRVPLEAPEPPAKRLIVMPGDPDFKDPKTEPAAPQIGTEEPLRVWRKPKKKLARGKYAELWQEAISKLHKLIQEKMPQKMIVKPEGASSNVTIECRNISSDVQAGMVKIEYGPKQTQSNRSNGTGRLGQANLPDEMDAMRIDLVVSCMFQVEQPTVNWELAAYRIKKDAEKVFRPRPKEIVNHTPRVVGNELSLRDAGAFSDQIQGPDGNMVDVYRDTAKDAQKKEYADFMAWKELQAGR